jgi:hypothetical protein
MLQLLDSIPLQNPWNYWGFTEHSLRNTALEYMRYRENALQNVQKVSTVENKTFIYKKYWK